MKLRIKFSKHGAVKFVGHLDMMRYFQKAIRRADIDICYSEGFSPHQVMSFASPLGVGITSNGEYLDIEVNSWKGESDMISRLNQTMAEGVKVLACYILADNAKNAMSMVAAADYTLRFCKRYEPENLEDYFRKLLDFYSQDTIEILKKTKRGEALINIRPLIYQLEVRDDVIYLKLSSGSSDNLKPELVMDAFYQYINLQRPEFAFEIQREEVYGDIGSDGQPSLIPLGLIGAKE